MKQIAEHLHHILIEYAEKLQSVNEFDYADKPDQTRWSKKEILGHLIDSAQCNIRRFIIGQYEDAPSIMYNQDKWVAISNYQNHPAPDLINLWILLNKHICIILKNTTVQTANRVCKTNNDMPRTLHWLAEDYVRHLLHHLHQILLLDPVAYP
jgi:hypothetical protein